MRRAVAPLFLLCLQAAAAVRLHAATGRRHAPVAAVVPVFLPHFNYLQDFMMQWQRCPEGRAAMDVFVVFSTQEDADHFREFLAPYLDSPCADPGAGCGGSLPYEELVVSRSEVDEGRFKSWKKLDGLAQVLELPGRSYDFAVMMDAEIAVANCQGFAQLHAMLERKHASKVVYGFKTGPNTDDARENIVTAACAISVAAGAPVAARANGSLLRAGSSSSQACEPAIMDRLRSQLANFTIYTWWNDLPYVHMETARRMFGSWAASLKIAQEKSGKAKAEIGTLRDVAREWMSGAAAGLPTPTEVTRAMGSSPPGVEELGVASGAFEHLVYQFYTVAHEGFVVRDIRQRLFSPVLGLISPGENFCELSEADKNNYVELVEPLWQPSGCDIYAMPYGPPLLIFHLNRWSHRGR